jgi:hypothetical protein
MSYEKLLASSVEFLRTEPAPSGGGESYAAKQMRDTMERAQASGVQAIVESDDRWRLQKVCTKPGVDISVFFPPLILDENDNRVKEPREPRNIRLAAAAAICGECAVQPQCLAERLALPRTRDYGFGAGMTENKRDDLRRELRQQSGQ